jgi:hypothetical protein
MKYILNAALILISFLAFLGCKRERVYYVPETKLYVKTIMKGSEDYGYILFSRDSNMTLSKNIDYVKSNLAVDATFILNLNDPDFIGLFDNKNIIEVNQVKFHFEEDISDTNSIYYEKRYMTNPLIIKKPYFELVIFDYFMGKSIITPEDNR